MTENFIVATLMDVPPHCRTGVRRQLDPGQARLVEPASLEQISMK
jgi:hypothetical protein